MVNKKSLCLTVLMVLANLFACAEYKNDHWPHKEFKYKDGMCYRIEGDVPNLGVLKTKEGEVQVFPENERGLFISQVREVRYMGLPEGKNCAELTIIPTIVCKNEHTQMLFKKSGADLFWDDYEEFSYNCEVYVLKIFENGISMVINNRGSETKVCLELKDDGKYYEVDDEGLLGKIEQTMDFADYESIHHFEFYKLVKPQEYDGFCFFSINKKEKKIEEIILQCIIFFNQTETGLEFITPYGAGFYSFETKEINLVPKKTYLGRQFYYFEFCDSILWFYNGKMKKKILSADDLKCKTFKMLDE